MPWPDSSGNLIVHYDLMASSFQALRFMIWANLDEDDSVDSPKSKRLEADVVRVLNQFARSFRMEIGLQGPIEISAAWENDILLLKAKGLSQLNQVLFYHYVKHKLSLR
jgi:hypothetical protein